MLNMKPPVNEPTERDLETIPVDLRKPVAEMDCEEMLRELVTVARVLETAVSQLSKNPMLASMGAFLGG